MNVVLYLHESLCKNICSKYYLQLFPNIEIENNHMYYYFW